jgi:hypothetical protein
MPIYRAPPRAINGVAVTTTDDQTVDGYKVHTTGRTANRSLGSIGDGTAGELEIKGNGTGASLMTFHRPGSFATYFGLDTDNKLKWGGWSHGAGVARELIDRNHIVGTVAGNPPTGAIIERGSNANGQYVRYADGTQICWHINGVGLTANQAFGTLWFNGSANAPNFTFPIAFSSAPIVMANINDFSAGPSWAVMDTKPTTTLSGRIYVVATSSGVVGAICYVAIGRWF